MDFELEWELKLFREEQPSLFDEVGERYSATPIGDKTAKRMLNIINLLESALEKQSEQQSNCNLPHVSVSLLSDLPENKPLYKDSGLWQLRTDDMDDVIIQQHSDESDEDFLEKCREIQREKERNER